MLKRTLYYGAICVCLMIVYLAETEQYPPWPVPEILQETKQLLEKPVLLKSSITLKCQVDYDPTYFQVRKEDLRFYADICPTNENIERRNRNTGKISVTTKCVCDPVRCYHNRVFRCKLSVMLKTGNKREGNTYSDIKVRVRKNPEKPTNITFEPKRIHENGRVIFTCVGNVGKPPRALEMYLQSRNKRIGLPIMESLHRKNDPDNKETCITIQTITSSIKFPDRSYSSVFCRIKSDPRKSREKRLVFADKEETPSVPDVEKAKSSALIKTVVGVAISILALLFILCGIFYVSHKRKQGEEQQPTAIFIRANHSIHDTGSTGQIVDMPMYGEEDYMDMKSRDDTFRSRENLNLESSMRSGRRGSGSRRYSMGHNEDTMSYDHRDHQDRTSSRYDITEDTTINEKRDRQKRRRGEVSKRRGSDGSNPSSLSVAVTKTTTRKTRRRVKKRDR